METDLYSRMYTKKRAPLSLRRRCEASPPGESRDWASLPRDVLCIVLGRLRQTDILRGAGLVCSSWRRLALEEPLLWRNIDLTDGNPWYRPKLPPREWNAMVCAAVDRSAGRCESFTGHVDDADVLVHLADRAPLLRNLEVARWPCIPADIPVTGIIEKLPLLERFVLWGGELLDDLLVALLDHCPHLELLDATQCYPLFGDWEEPTRRRIRSSTVEDLRLPLYFGTVWERMNS